MTADDVREVIERFGLSAVLYYPEIHVDDEDYELLGQADWCLEPIADELSADARAAVRELLARGIVNPTVHREDVTGTLMDLSPAE